MTVIDVLSANKKSSVMNDTWGHFYPKPGSKHKGKILICSGIWGGSTILNYSFPTLGSHGSPQEAELIRTALGMYDFADGIYEIECTLWFYKTSDDMYLGSRIGKIIKPTLKTLVDLSNWN